MSRRIDTAAGLPVAMQISFSQELHFRFLGSISACQGTRLTQQFARSSAGVFLCGTRSAMRYVGTAFLTLFLPCVLNAQAASTLPNTPEPQLDITGSLPEPAHYKPPTTYQRWQSLYQNGFAPGTLVTSAFGAGLNQATNDVPEWGQGAEGYGRRLGWVALNTAAQSTIESGSAALLHEDTIYYRCSCSGFWQRSAHALGSQLTARKPDGSRRLSLARPLGAYGGSLVLVPILPDRFNYEGDGIRNGTWSYASGFPVNMLREFWPEIRRGVFRKP